MGIDKLIIRTYNDLKLQLPGSVAFELPINPESYTRNLKVVYDKRTGDGGDGSEARFKVALPQELRLEFVFDGTDTVQGYKHEGKPVKKQLEEFLNTVYFIDGKIHRPRFLEINWGTLIFPCTLKSIDLNYTLFEENGDPLRVKLNCTFSRYTSKEESARFNRLSSADLTHLRLIQPGDRLDLMTFKIYNDSKYVLEVARANGLTSIRNIKHLVGKEIQFPPLQKSADK